MVLLRNGAKASRYQFRKSEILLLECTQTLFNSKHTLKLTQTNHGPMNKSPNFQGTLEKKHKEKYLLPLLPLCLRQDTAQKIKQNN